MKNTTKNTVTIIRNFAITGMIALIAVIGFAGCTMTKEKYPPFVKSGKTVAETVKTDGISRKITGGWNAGEDMTVTDDLKKVFVKATDGLIGADYEPVAYLGSQVVSGLNHCFLAKVTAVYPGAVPHYCLVFIYENISGDVQITEIRDIEDDGLAEGLPFEITGLEDMCRL